MNFPALLSINLTLFLLIICGWLCRRWKIIDTAASKRFSKLILSVGQPMLIVASLNNAEYSPENLKLAGQVTLLGFALHALIATLAYFMCKLIKRNFNKAKIFEFSLVFVNCGFIGFPILECPEAAEAIVNGDKVSVDIATGVITDETTGKTFQATAFPGFINQIIENGGLLPYLKARQEA